jgi:hypothetical protein
VRDSVCVCLCERCVCVCVCVCVSGVGNSVGCVSSSVGFNRLYIFAPGGQTMNVVYQKALE